ncbi:unnamed protein product [Echinostoma caproni]|uniref:C2H2-type domain-containing protein n=1 Tax=Echinostoma caproni TaxID=27848 RepID=A0A183BBM3_9TREM|nr:unnamed protein product [Echinostoma caproni]
MDLWTGEKSVSPSEEPSDVVSPPLPQAAGLLSKCLTHALVRSFVPFIQTLAVSVSAGAPVSLFPGAVALKTLQELTGSGSNNVNNLSASDAASAVAAMAAAALSGLTGFDVSAPTIASVPSQAFPVTLTSIPSSLSLNPSKILPTLATLVSPAQTTTTSTTSGSSAGVTPSVAPSVSLSTTTRSATISGNLASIMTDNASSSGKTANNTTTTTTAAGTKTTLSSTTISDTSTTNSVTTCTPNAPVSEGPQEEEEEPIESIPENKPEATDDRTYPDYTGRVGDDMVSFPFDEDKFRSELSSHIRPPILDRLVSKMCQFSSYLVRILGKENHRRIPVCPECGKVFPYGLGDFKRHLLTVHLEVPREYLKDCLRFTYLPKSEEKFQEVQEQLAMRQMRPRMLEAGKRRVPLPYSIAILRRLTNQLPVSTREFLEQKMQLYSRLSVIVDTRGGFRRYKCNHCSYTSPHALADVRKHILGSHCGISTKHFRHCLQASRLDPVEFTLLSDEKLGRLAKEFLNRRHGSDLAKAESRSPSPAESVERNGGVNEVSSSLSNTSTPPVTETRTQDTYVSRFTAMVPGSKNPVTVRIRPPVPPDASSAANDSGLAVGSSSSLGSPTMGHSTATGRCSPTQQFAMPQSPLESPESEDEFQAITSVDHLDLTALPSIPGLEGADRVVDLPLPYSEPVLRKLLECAGATEAQIKDLVAKMQVYATYTMTRICRRDRTLAFRCPCGRLFVTTRQPDSGIRAATLADSRRHVMGVHARISHEFITICCQASRITRDYDFELYSDDMLLRLAMERPIKLSSVPSSVSHNSTSASPSPAVNNPTSSSVPIHRTSSHPSTQKNFKELAPYPPILPNLSNSHVTRRSVSIDLNSESGLNADTRDSMHTPNSASHRDQNEDSIEDRDNSDPESSGTRKAQIGLEDPLAHLTKAQASSSEEVERIINLPYSSEALYSLVQGYCPASYFPVLEVSNENSRCRTSVRSYFACVFTLES